MTNGEKLISDFPYIEIKGQDEVFTTIQIDTKGLGTPIIVYTDWWNSEYKEPTTKNDLGVDCISRQAVLDIAKASKSNWIDNSILFKRVNALPSVTPIRPKGHWIKIGDRGFGWSDTVICKCSECGIKKNFVGKFDGHNLVIDAERADNYCSNCGSDNREVEE